MAVADPERARYRRALGAFIALVVLAIVAYVILHSSLAPGIRWTVYFVVLAVALALLGWSRRSVRA